MVYFLFCFFLDNPGVSFNYVYLGGLPNNAQGSWGPLPNTWLLGCTVQWSDPEMPHNMAGSSQYYTHLAQKPPQLSRHPMLGSSVVLEIKSVALCIQSKQSSPSELYVAHVFHFKPAYTGICNATEMGGVQLEKANLLSPASSAGFFIIRLIPGYVRRIKGLSSLSMKGESTWMLIIR